MIQDFVIAEAAKLAPTKDGSTTPAQIPAFPYIFVTWGNETYRELLALFVLITLSFRISVYAKGKDAKKQASNIADALVKSLAGSDDEWFRIKSKKIFQLPATEIFCCTIDAEAMEVKSILEI